MHIQSLSQALSGTLKNEMCKPEEKGNSYFKTNSTCVVFITFNNVVQPAIVCLRYLYLFLPGHIIF